MLRVATFMPCPAHNRPAQYTEKPLAGPDLMLAVALWACTGIRTGGAGRP